jgi:serine-type D-Ala-D-Ala carboxypeptidase/endopeptidase
MSIHSALYHAIRSFLFCLLLVFQSPQAGTTALPHGAVLNPAQTDSLLAVLKERVEKHKKTPGIVVGLVSGKGTQVVAWGKSGNKAGEALDGATLFEIGSITKVFTTIVLADMTAKGELKLDDPAQNLLPSGVKMPSRDGKEITLYNLATHTSGLPQIPSNMLDMDESNPYAAYTPEKLYAFLNGYELSKPVGGKSSYSNLGMGLLGHLLSLKAGKSYEELVLSRICAPLGMTSTRITLTREDYAHLAEGHDAGGKAVRNWDFDALAGCGALRSTADDMLRFLAANMGLVDSPLLPAMRETHRKRESLGVEGMDIGLGWQIMTLDSLRTVWHNGGTGGYRSFAGFSPDRGLGVVVLTNSFCDIDDIGLHILNPAVPLMDFEKPREIKLPESVLHKYEGYYELQPGVVFTIKVRDGQLTAQLTGQPTLVVYPESETVFCYKEVPARLEFKLNEAGEPASLVLHQNGLSLPARKLGPDYAPPPAPVAVKLERGVMRQYEGEYTLTPQMTLTVFLKGDKLFVQATGQSAGEVIPVSETEFVNEQAGARFVFKKDGQGKVTGLVLFQAGMELPAAKVK